MQDGASFFQGVNLRVGFYDRLFTHAANLAGEEDFYRGFTAETDSVLEAACGTGRLFGSLSGPGRLLAGFDASLELLRQARKNHPTVPLSLQRLESFAFGRRFTRIVVGYYGLSYVLDAAGRTGHMRCLAAHLEPDGRALIHLPDAEILRRPIPDHEMAAFQGSRSIRDQATGFEGALTHRVSEATLEADGAVRAMHFHFALRNSQGAILREETAAMRYAILDEDDLARLAASAGLRILDIRKGFSEGIDSELIAILAKA
ncbi:class I SAM-dependent methyltransferase [Oceanibaculum pacificum]|uniref:Methyltransferase domain-containing protein n=1 Tax=Oceanibaculum pacificum TaxID=580166 RepID=A0A154W8K7_9PROT|nr:methyltransferase domain-containing protein [Oceanibaculum pacificum]KZD09793.1 hypothetical protein AUP43_01015 [Oceanibaculum pacificum]